MYPSNIENDQPEPLLFPNPSSSSSHYSKQYSSNAPISHLIFPYFPFQDNNNNSIIDINNDNIHHHHHEIPDYHYKIIDTASPRNLIGRSKRSSLSSCGNWKSSSTSTCMTKMKMKMKRDRHSKIKTARGVRDRRMRLSLDVAKRFFGLQDMLGFDKASKTVEWLLDQAKTPINHLEIQYSSANNNSHDELANVNVNANNIDNNASTSTNCVGNTNGGGHHHHHSSKKSRFSHLNGGGGGVARESRAKARERARERTKEKMRARKLLLVAAANDDNDDGELSKQRQIVMMNDNIIPFLDIDHDHDHVAASLLDLPISTNSSQLATRQNLWTSVMEDDNNNCNNNNGDNSLVTMSTKWNSTSTTPCPSIFFNSSLLHNSSGIIHEVSSFYFHFSVHLYMLNYSKFN